MDIIDKSAPMIDPNRLEESLQRFRDYMVETLNLIDFTLSNQKNRISGAVSEENFQQLALAVAALAVEGETVIEDCRHVERGYEDLCRDLRALGAQAYWG